MQFSVGLTHTIVSLSASTCMLNVSITIYIYFSVAVGRRSEQMKSALGQYGGHRVTCALYARYVRVCVM